jgi:hypothetical protein
MAHHRSGSNFLSDLLQTHPGIECLNEPLSMHTRLFREQDLVQWEASDFDSTWLHPCLAGEPALRVYLLELRQYLLQSRHGRIVGFKDTCLFGKLGWLKAFLPELRIIFLRRDPRAIVSSVLRSNLAVFWRYAELVLPVFAQLCPGYVSRADTADTAVLAAEVVAKSVAARYELARRTVGLFKHLSLDLEDIAQDPERCLQTLGQFLGVETESAQASFIAARQSESRGGLFSSFRSVGDVEDTWRRLLNARQLAVIEDVMCAMREPCMTNSPARMRRA